MGAEGSENMYSIPFIPPAQPPLGARLLGGLRAPDVPTGPWPGRGADSMQTVQWEARGPESAWDRVGKVVATGARDGIAGGVSHSLKAQRHRTQEGPVSGDSGTSPVTRAAPASQPCP